MNEYTEIERSSDFEYFKEVNSDFFEKHGQNFLAIRNKQIISYKKSIQELISEMLKKGYQVGSYLMQECKGLESDYTNTVMRLMISA